jgi:hypothetical protein
LHGLIIYRITDVRDTQWESEEDFKNHRSFQLSTLSLLHTLLPLPFPSLLIPCLCNILYLDPHIVLDSNAMDIVFHFIVTAPENPATRNTLVESLEFVMRRVGMFCEERGEKGLGGEGGRWIERGVGVLEVVKSRPKGDALVEVRHVFYATWGFAWVELMVGYTCGACGTFGELEGGFGWGDGIDYFPHFGRDITS